MLVKNADERDIFQNSRGNLLPVLPWLRRSTCGWTGKALQCPAHPCYSECVPHTQSDDITMKTTRSRTRRTGLIVPVVNPVTVPCPLWRDVNYQIAEWRDDLRLQCARNHQRIEKFSSAVRVRNASATVITEILRRRFNLSPLKNSSRERHTSRSLASRA